MHPCQIEAIIESTDHLSWQPGIGNSRTFHQIYTRIFPKSDRLRVRRGEATNSVSVQWALKQEKTDSNYEEDETSTFRILGMIIWQFIPQFRIFGQPNVEENPSSPCQRNDKNTWRCLPFQMQACLAESSNISQITVYVSHLESENATGWESRKGTQKSVSTDCRSAPLGSGGWKWASVRMRISLSISKIGTMIKALARYPWDGFNRLIPRHS